VGTVLLGLMRRLFSIVITDYFANLPTEKAAVNQDIW